MLYKHFDTFVFDYDGTLFDSLEHAKHVYYKVGHFAKSKGYIETLWNHEQVASLVGLNPIMVWKSLLPHASDEVRAQLSALYSQTMIEYLNTIKTQWYPLATQVVQALLTEGKECVLLTNARRYYVDIALQHHPVLKSFKYVVCAQDYNYQSKAEIISHLELYGRVVVIGDKIDDALAAKQIQATSVWATYGYGTFEVDGIYFDKAIQTIDDLIKL